jgi:hypothetical protein
MKERPILFSGEMVRAILAGRKTQTRRVMKPGPPPEEGVFRYGSGWRYSGVDYDDDVVVESCPYGVPGDRLWVRETWKENQPPSGWIYRATDESSLDPRDERPWQPSIFMPRRASRITLELTEVRVQRLQEISEEDARAEGVLLPVRKVDETHSVPLLCLTGAPSPSEFKPGQDWSLSDYWRHAFAIGWNGRNGKRGYGWDSNPWVWAISFRKLEAGEVTNAG